MDRIFFTLRIFFVQVPLTGIVLDIGADLGQGLVVPDNVVVESGLPTKILIASRSDALGAFGFELVNDCT